MSYWWHAVFAINGMVVVASIWHSSTAPPNNTALAGVLAFSAVLGWIAGMWATDDLPYQRKKR